MYYVYILVSEKNLKKTYVGITDNIEKRLKRHNSGYEEFTKSNLPWKVETFIAFSSKELAYRFEKYLKHGSGHAFLKKRFLPELFF